MATKSKQKLPSRIPVDPVRSLDGFSLGDRVAYREESVFRFSQEDVDTKACPPNDFVIRSFVSRDGQSSAYLIDADGNNAGCEETHNLDNVGTYTLPFPCRHINGRWFNARTGAAITAQIIGWRSLQPSSR